MSDFNRDNIERIYEKYKIPIPETLTGVDVFMPILERMREEGTVVVLKLDGQRTNLDGNGQYTVVVSGGPLKDKYLRVDTNTVEEALVKVISYYATEVWITNDAKF